MSADALERLRAALGGYRIERELGGGGMSRVFLAEESTLHRQVVIKVLAPELVLSTERFAREVKFAARLQQANIVPVLTAGVADGLPYYTMPFVRGESLRARLAPGKGLGIAEAVGILRDVARAIGYAHGEGVVHRDIKPENILLSSGAAVVTDFGIAKAVATSRTEDGSPAATVTLTSAGSSVGTPAYMAPEQALGDPTSDHRADLYSWGVVAWELLAGRHPFSTASTPQSFVAAHLSEAAPDLRTMRRDVPASLATIVRRCLEKDPARRPASAAEVLGALDDIATPQPGPPIATKSRSNLMIAAAAVVVVALIVAGVWALQDRALPPAAGTTQEKSIAVLPFESVGGDTANVYFAEGIADELTTALASVQGLRVAATSSAFTYRGKTVDPRDVGKALNVSTVLQGRVRRAGAVLRVSAQLTNSADGIVLWSRSFDRDAKDVFAVQDDLTREIVGALKITLVGDAPGASGQGTRDIEAHDLYLRGLYFLNRRGPGVRQSIAYFQQALTRDSTFARAWAQLGTAYGLLPIFESIVMDSALGPARVAIDHALRLDSLSAEAHAASGLVLAMTGQWNAAEAEYRRAIALDPNYVVTYRLALSTYAILSRETDALAAVRVLLERDPLSATSGAVIALTQLSFGYREEALAAANRAMELDSMTAMSRGMLAMTQLAAGQPEVAREHANRAIHTPNTTPWIGWVFGATGDQSAAAALTREMEQQRGRNATAELTIALIALGARDTTRALEYLERSARAREAVSYMAPFGLPAYDPIRQSARFAAVIRAFGTDPTPFIRPSAARQ